MIRVSAGQGRGVESGLVDGPPMAINRALNQLPGVELAAPHQGHSATSGCGPLSRHDIHIKDTRHPPAGRQPEGPDGPTLAH